MDKEKIVIWGAKGPALVVADILRLRKDYEIVGYLDNKNLERKGESFGGATVLGGDEQLDDLIAKGIRNMIVAIQNNKVRLRLAELAKTKGFKLVSAIHPSASVAESASIGAGSVVRAQSAIGPQSAIGENCIIGYGAMISHDCSLGRGVHVSSGVNLAGGTRIGECSWIGLGVTVIDPCKVGSHSIVGAGSLVTKDIPDDVVAYGSPAKIIRKNINKGST